MGKADPAAGTGRKADLPCLASCIAYGSTAGTAEAVQPERLPEALQTEGRNARVINALQTAAEAPGKHTTREKCNCIYK